MGILKNNKEKLSRRIKVQEKIIQTLERENTELKIENNELKQQLNFEQLKPVQGYERAKEIMTELTFKNKELETLINEARKTKEFYEIAIKEILSLKTKYVKDITNAIKETKKQFANIKKF